MKVLWQVSEAATVLMKSERFQADDRRNRHVHTGEFQSDEFQHIAFGDRFFDPSFYEAHSAMWRIARVTVIEWLRRGPIQ